MIQIQVTKSHRKKETGPWVSTVSVSLFFFLSPIPNLTISLSGNLGSQCCCGSTILEFLFIFIVLSIFFFFSKIIWFEFDNDAFLLVCYVNLKIVLKLKVKILLTYFFFLNKCSNEYFIFDLNICSDSGVCGLEKKKGFYFNN